MSGKKLAQRDHSLVWELQKVTTGANAHKINNLLGAYYGYVDCVNSGNEGFILHVERMEKEIRQFIAIQRRHLFAVAGNCYQ